VYHVFTAIAKEKTAELWRTLKPGVVVIFTTTTEITLCHMYI
jgi:hypothetical protein